MQNQTLFTFIVEDSEKLSEARVHNIAEGIALKKAELENWPGDYSVECISSEMRNETKAYTFAVTIPSGDTGSGSHDQSARVNSKNDGGIAAQSL